MKFKEGKSALAQHIENAAEQLFTAIAAIKDPAEARDFFNDLCTPAELQAMADRWQVVRPLKDKVPYRKIYEDTGVSVTTIGRVARNITHGSGGYNTIYARLEKKNNVK